MHTAPASIDETPSQSANTDSPASPITIDVNQLFRQHQRHLLRFVQRYLRNSDDVEDVVQNTFLEAVRCAHRFSGLSKPSTWLFGIALNLARSQVRRNCADMYETVDEAYMDQIADLHSDPAQLVEQRQIFRKIQTKLEELPPNILATFSAVLEGASTYEEAAEYLQVPVGTVRSRVSRVRATVRAEFG